jgi:hypothetical protein
MEHFYVSDLFYSVISKPLVKKINKKVQENIGITDYH